MSRVGISGQTVTLGAKFYDNGVLFTPYSIDPVKIYDAETGGNLLKSLVPELQSTGFYQVAWITTSSLETGTYYDEWIWTATENLPNNTKRFEFTITNNVEEANEPEAVFISGCRPTPTWVHFIGMRIVQDMGNGMGIRLQWGDALPVNYNKTVHYNVYYSTSHWGVFSEGPKAITKENTVVVNVDPGKVYYFAVKATEFNTDEFDITQLTQIATNLYQYPTEQTLQADIDAYGASVAVESSAGFPEHGFLLIGAELMYYASKDTTTFFVEDVDRGSSSTSISTHSSGDTVALWRGFEDQNTSMEQGVADWFHVNGIPRNQDALGQLNVDADGYRAANEDSVTTDLTASDQNTQDFPSYDYTGYHRPSLQETFSGACVNSYVGGDFNGGRGFSLQDRILSQLDSMIQVTGEPAILLKRKWTGPRCRCISLRREHPRERCPYCYGVGFHGGYDRFTNTRAISEMSTNTQGMIMIRVQPYTNDLEIVQDQGLRQSDELVAWTLTFPTLKDRDVIVRFSEDGIEEFRYEILNVTRNKLFFGQSGRQEFKMRRLDKTDMIYTFATLI